MFRWIPLTVAASLCLCQVLSGESGEVLVLRKVNVVPMDEEQVLRDRTVVIADGWIRTVSSDQDDELPEGARMLDASGKYLMPGLAEMHAHVPGSNEEESYRNDVLFLYLANGVTLIRGMLGDPVHLEVREQLAQGELLGPRLITAGPAFSGQSAPSAERATELVQEQAQAGYDFIKVASGSPDAFEAMVEAAREADLPFSGHVPAEVGIARALEAGYASIDHLDAYMPGLVHPEETAGLEGGFFGFRLAPHVEEDRVKEMARRTEEAGVWNVPTESLMHSVLIARMEDIDEARPEFRYMPRQVVDGWKEGVRRQREDPHYDAETAEEFMRVRRNLIRALHQKKAGLLLGSDAPQYFNVPGFSLHREMERMAEAGLTPYEVLRTGTVNPAVFLDESTFGKVAEGMRADLILLDANPLEDLAHARRIAGVIRQGRWISRDEIDRRLEEIARRHKAAP